MRKAFLLFFYLQLIGCSGLRSNANYISAVEEPQPARGSGNQDIAMMLAGIKVPIGQVTVDKTGLEVVGIDRKSIEIVQYPDDSALRLIEWLDLPEGSSDSVSHHFNLVRLVPPQAISLLKGSWSVYFKGGSQDLTTGIETIEHIPGSITIDRERRHRSFELSDSIVARGTASVTGVQAAPQGHVAIVDEYRMTSTYIIRDHNCQYKSTNLWNLVRHGEDVHTIMKEYTWQLKTADNPVEGDFLWFRVLNEPALADDGP